MTLTIYGTPVSQPTRSLEWFCNLNNIPFDFKIVRLDKGEHRSAEFKKINPNAKIPVMDDDGFILYESTAIARYLVQKYQKELNIPEYWYPQDLQMYGKINSYLDWHHTTFRPGIAGRAFTKVIGPITFGAKFSEEQVEKARVNSLNVLKSFNDQWLKQGAFIAGNSKPSIADLFAYGELVQLIVTFPEAKFSDWEELKSVPQVKDWALRMESLPHFDKIHGGLFKFKNFVQKKMDSKL